MKLSRKHFLRSRLKFAKRWRFRIDIGLFRHYGRTVPPPPPVAACTSSFGATVKFLVFFGAGCATCGPRCQFFALRKDLTVRG